MVYLAEDSSEETETESHETRESEEELDDYLAYLQGYDMDKYGNEHAKFKAAEKAMMKRQHEKVTKVRWELFVSQYMAVVVPLRPVLLESFKTVSRVNFNSLLTADQALLVCFSGIKLTYFPGIS